MHRSSHLQAHPPQSPAPTTPPHPLLPQATRFGSNAIPMVSLSQVPVAYHSHPAAASRRSMIIPLLYLVRHKELSQLEQILSATSRLSMPQEPTRPRSRRHRLP